MIMRNTINHTLALIILSCATVVFAADSASMSTSCLIVSEDESLYRVIFQAAKEENVTVQLFNDQQESLYKEDIQSSAFNKKYDLSSLPYGDYTLEVKSGGYVYSEQLTLGDLSSFQFNLEQKEDKKVSLVGSKKEGKNMTLYILNDEKDVIYKEQFDQDTQIHKKYNFQELKGDRVTFLLYHADLLITEKDFVF